MDFQTAIRTCFSKYATFSGRARRAELWWFWLFTLLTSAVLQVVDGALFGQSAGGQPVGVLAPLFGLAVLLPSLAVGARRLHDTNRSGWWLLLMLIPILGTLVLIWFFVTQGDEGPNDYGPDPIATG